VAADKAGRERNLSDNKILVCRQTSPKKSTITAGDLSRVEFIEALIDNLVTDKPESKGSGKVEYASKTELLSFEQDMKLLLKSFLDFFMALWYGVWRKRAAPRNRQVYQANYRVCRKISALKTAARVMAAAKPPLNGNLNLTIYC